MGRHIAEGDSINVGDRVLIDGGWVAITRIVGTQAEERGGVLVQLDAVDAVDDSGAAHRLILRSDCEYTVSSGGGAAV